MDMQIVNDKAKKLCDIGACCSMAQARRVVMGGAFERVMEKAQQNAKVENQDSIAPSQSIIGGMKLNLVFGTALCYVKEFTINGIAADYEDFGEKYDRSPYDAGSYGCGNMQFTRVPVRTEILEKYHITEAEYSQVCEKLEDGLSFGFCSRCA